jgi:phosphoribosylaminoimidazole-succinocarboxamide synthase
MTAQKNKKISQDEMPQESTILEYPDYFITQKNKKLASKNLGEKTAALNSYFFEYIKEYNIPSAYLKKVNKKSIAFLKVEEFPFRIRIINAADTRTSKIFSIKVGLPLQLPVMEYHFGDSKESLITESHIISFNLCTYDELKLINRICSKLNAIIKSFFERRNVSLLELTCRFGKFDGKVLLIDDFSSLSIKTSNDKTDAKFPDPFKIETAAQMNKYADFLQKLTRGE